MGNRSHGSHPQGRQPKKEKQLESFIKLGSQALFFSPIIINALSFCWQVSILASSSSTTPRTQARPAVTYQTVNSLTTPDWSSAVVMTASQAPRFSSSPTLRKWQVNNVPILKAISKPANCSHNISRGSAVGILPQSCPFNSSVIM